MATFKNKIKSESNILNHINFMKKYGVNGKDMSNNYSPNKKI